MSYTVAVLRGGPSSEYDVSLKSGAAVLHAIGSESGTYRVHDVLIDKAGQWHRNGFATTPAQALHGVDAAVIAMHGTYGEDGTVQRLLDTLSVPYVGSGAQASATAMHKPRARFEVAALPMIKLAEHYVVHEEDGFEYEDIARDIFNRFGPPYIVKPATGGSSVGLMVARSLDELADVLAVAGHIGGYPILVEQFIKGKEVTSGVVEGFRDAEHYTLPPVEIVLPAGKELFDYEAKYSTDESACAQEHCPALTLTREQKQQIEDAAKAVHQALGLRDYSRSDFILAPHGLYFLETNTLPGLTEQSLLPKSLTAVGSNLREFLEHTLERAMSRRA